MLLVWPVTHFACDLSIFASIRRVGLALPSAADLLSDTGGSTGLQSHYMSLAANVSLPAQALETVLL